MFSVWFSGLLLGLSLIVVIGVQNGLVLRQGLRREHLGVVVAVCALSDAVLIATGTAGMGVVAQSHPAALRALSWVGACYLVWCAIGSFHAAMRPGALEQGEPRSRGSVLGTVFAVTWLNPHVYLDTVVMLGSIAASHGALRWVFALGAVSASVLWFCTIGFGARALSGPLGRPSVWRVLDVLIGLVMLVVAAGLVF